MPTSPTDALSELRQEIDRIDLAMHRLLMERGEIIHRLIEVKRAQGGACAFRTGRTLGCHECVTSSGPRWLAGDTLRGN